MHSFKSWAKALFQPATFLGVAMAALVWLGLIGHQSTERRAAQQSAVQNTTNLARAFEMHLAVTVSEIDKRLLSAREAFQNAPHSFKLTDEFAPHEFKDGAAFSASYVLADGTLKASTGGPIVGRIDVSETESFKFHVTNERDQIVISKPVLGRVTHKWSLHISRRLHNADGSFAGLIAIAVDPYHFVRMYDSIDLGLQGYVAIIGTDRAFRAVGGHTFDVLGKTFTDRAFEDIDQRSSGWKLSDSEWGDGIRRLVSYRTLKDYPLIIAVAQSQQDIYAAARVTDRAYQLFATIITILIAIGTGFGIAGRLRLESIQSALNKKNIWFKATLDNMRQGVCMFDSDKRVVVTNRRYAELYGLDASEVAPGTSLEEILTTRLAKGTYRGPKPEEYVRSQVHAPLEVQEIPDGRVVEIVRQQMADGGWVTTHDDITERERYGRRIAHLAHHDPLTSAANRLLLHDRVSEAFARLMRTGEQFSLFLIDLDHFKTINDTLGHAGGDALLCTVVQRLEYCVREMDTVARIGGDEFAILQSGLQSSADAIALAERIRSTVNESCVIDGVTIEPRLSIGISIAPHDAESTEMLFKTADLALYRAKESGRNQYRLYGEMQMLAA